MIEHTIWEQNPNQYVIGADEVGRGCFAGPIVGCAVKINQNDSKHLSEVKDSKKLSPKKRNEIFNQIKDTDIIYAISICDNNQIDKYGIQKANQVVLSESINKLMNGSEKIYVDHFNIDIGNAESLTRGEDKSISIALASIIANELNEASPVSMYFPALIGLGLILLFVSLAVNVCAHLIIRRVTNAHEGGIKGF